MPLPRFLARVNRRFTNRLLIGLAQRPPFAALTHAGRTTGREYRVPINAFPMDDGFLIVPTYGIEADWVKNVFAAGRAVLDYDGRVFRLHHPALLGRADVWQALPATVRTASRILGIHEYMFLAQDTDDVDR